MPKTFYGASSDRAGPHQHGCPENQDEHRKGGHHGPAAAR